MARVADLASARARVGEFARLQRVSLGAFWNASEQVFFRTYEGQTPTDDELPADQVGDRTSIKRLTSTVTCLESLLEVPDWLGGADEWWTNARASEKLGQFMSRSLVDDTKWESDGGAWVYCRARTLGSALRLTNGGVNWSPGERQTAAKLIQQAWSSRYAEAGDFGLREATNSFGSIAVEELQAKNSDQQYPANAFLTYWGLLAARSGASLTDGELIPAKEVAAALGWMRQNLASQIAFRYGDSSHADPQQLLWSLTGLIRFGDVHAISNTTSPEHELLVAGLRAFFEQQVRGTWATGAPLFNYRNAGNAYAYVYETLAELLSLATSREVDEVVSTTLSKLLSAYSSELMLALDRAEETAQALHGLAIGWSSGHHPHRDAPESWATASVFRFAQALRRLIGRWSREDAGAKLNWRPARKNLRDLQTVGGSWNFGSGSAGAFLATAFVHPTNRAAELRDGASRFLPDPDEKILANRQFRSTMLFGPPGTAKTTMVEAVAGAINWRFVEITPAQFLDHGVDRVSSRADEIFRQVMELDHCVVLLDEIDELIRTRTKEAGTLERFFTTTMLPRLAKLWENARVLFVVNTNSIKFVDPAIVRSQRFDAARLVLPSGYASKAARLAELGVKIQASEKDITEALREPDKKGEAQRDLGWFALIRHDQLDALATSAGPTDQPLDDAGLVSSMKRIARELKRLDWNLDGEPSELPPGMPPVPPEVPQLYEYERRDPRPIQVAKIAPCASDATWPESVHAKDGWVELTSQDDAEEWAKEANGRLTPDGFLHTVECDGTDGIT